MSFCRIFGNCFILNGYIICISDVFCVNIYKDLSIVRIIFKDDLIKDFIVSTEALDELIIYLTNELSINPSFEFMIK